MPIGRLFFEIGGDTKQLNESLKQAEKALEQAGLQATRAGQSIISKFDEALNPTKKLSEQIKLLEAAGKSQADIMKVMGSEIDQATKAAKAHGQPIDDIVKKYRSLDSQLKETGASMTKIGRSWSMYISAPIVAAGGIVTKFAMDFNESMANVATLIPKSAERVKELKTNVQDLAIATGKSTKDLADGLYQVISAFGDSADSAKILDVNARAAAAGLATTTDAINLTSAVTKGYGDVTADAVKKAADLAFQTVKLGQTTFPELAAAIGTIVPVAAKMNVVQEELYAGFATLTGVTGGAAEVSTQLAAILRAMIKPTEDMSAAIRKLGYSGAEALVSQLGMVESLKALMSTTDGSTEAIGKLFGRAEALTAVFALTGGQADDFTKKLDEMKQASGAMEEAFKEQTEGVNKFGFALSQIKERLEVAAQKLGDALIPVLEKLVPLIESSADKLIKLIEAFSKLPDPVQTTTFAIFGLTAAIGPLLLAAGGLLKLLAELKFISLITGATTATGAISGLTLAIKGLGIAAGITGAIFAGWKIGEWTDKLDLFGRHAKVATNEIYKTADALRKEAEELNFTGAQFDDFTESLKAAGQDPFKQHVLESIEEYRTRMEGVISVLKSAKSPFSELEQRTMMLDGEITNLAEATNDSTKELDKLKESTEKALKPLEALVDETYYYTKLLDILGVILPTIENQFADSEEALRRSAAAVDAFNKNWKDWRQEVPLAQQVEEDLRRETEELKRAMDATAKSTKWYGVETKEMFEGLDRQVSTVFTDLSREIADNIIEWDNWGDSILGIIKDFGKAALRIFIETLFSPLTQLMQGLANSFKNWLIGVFGGGAGGGGFNLGNLLGAGGNAGLGLLMGGLPLTLGMTQMENPFAQAGGIFGTGVMGLAGMTSLMTGMPLMTALTTLFTNPITALIGGGIAGGYGISKLADWLGGKTTFEAADKELTRDFAVAVTEKQMKAIFEEMGISEHAGYGIRKDILSSPWFLANVAGPLAQQQGVFDAFLKKLEQIQTSWGTFDFREAFETGWQTGNWEQLNKAFLQAWGEHTAGIEERLSDWEDKLLLVSDASEDLAESLTESGAEILATFDDMIRHFRETGEVLPKLREMMKALGADMEAFDTAVSDLSRLTKTMSAIEELRTGLNRLLPEKSPMEQVLAGEWSMDLAKQLADLGFDPSRLQPISELIRLQTGWDEAIRQFQQTSKMPAGGILEQALAQYGGSAGLSAINRLAQGFNTVTPQLLESTKTALDAAYRMERKTVIDYLEGLAEDTTAAIEEAQDVIDSELEMVGNSIVDAIDTGNTEIITILKEIRDAQLEERGRNTGDGFAISTRGTTESRSYRNQLTSREPPVIINHYGDNYGFEDFSRMLSRAEYENSRREPPKPRSVY